LTLPAGVDWPDPITNALDRRSRLAEAAQQRRAELSAAHADLAAARDRLAIARRAAAERGERLEDRGDVPALNERIAELEEFVALADAVVEEADGTLRAIVVDLRHELIPLINRAQAEAGESVRRSSLAQVHEPLGRLVELYAWAVWLADPTIDDGGGKGPNVAAVANQVEPVLAELRSLLDALASPMPEPAPAPVGLAAMSGPFFGVVGVEGPDGPQW